jgi:hypothetical protein
MHNAVNLNVTLVIDRGTSPYASPRSMTLEERVAEMKDQTPPEIRQAGTADFPRREAASFNQACERTGSSAGEFRCFFLIRALHLHPERGSQEPVAPLDR